MPALVAFLGRPAVHGAMSAAALLGPGRGILAAGFASARRGAPDMNSLVSLGAVAAFGVSCVAAALPQLAWRTFFEEPAMLLGVVLLGRTLEQRAKLQASSDMAALRVRTPGLPHLMCQRIRHHWSMAAGSPAEAAMCSLAAAGKVCWRGVHSCRGSADGLT